MIKNKEIYKKITMKIMYYLVITSVAILLTCTKNKLVFKPSEINSILIKNYNRGMVLDGSDYISITNRKDIITIANILNKSKKSEDDFKISRKYELLIVDTLKNITELSLGTDCFEVNKKGESDYFYNSNLLEIVELIKSKQNY